MGGVEDGENRICSIVARPVRDRALLKPGDGFLSFVELVSVVN